MCFCNQVCNLNYFSKHLKYFENILKYLQDGEIILCMSMFVWPVPFIHLLNTTTRMPFEILFVMLIGAMKMKKPQSIQVVVFSLRNKGNRLLCTKVLYVLMHLKLILKALRWFA